MTFSRQVGFNALGAVLNQGSGVVLLLLLTKCHGIAVTGEYGIALSTIGLVSTLAASALGLSLTRSVARCYRSNPSDAGAIVGLLYTCGICAACAFSVLLFLFADRIASVWLESPALSSTLRWFAPFAVGAVWNSLQLAVLSGIGRFDRVAAANAWLAVVRLSAVGCAIILGELHHVVVATVISQFIGSILVSVRLARELGALDIRPTLEGCWKHRDELWRFTLPNVISSATLGPVNWVCQMLLMQSPGGAAQVGVVAIAAQWQNVIRFLPQRTIEVALPESSKLASATDSAAYMRHLVRLMKSAGMIALAVGATCALLAPSIATLYGPGVEPFSSALAVSFFVASVSIVARIMTQDLLARDRARYELLLTAGRAALLLLIWWVIRDRSALSLAVVNLVSYGVLIIVLLPRWLRILGGQKE